MRDSGGDPRDPFSRANYRSLIAWPERLRREAPFLDRILAGIPERSVADLGCGTGEHARHLASLGYRVAGLDASAEMLAAATEEPLPPNLSFVRGDLREADRLLPGPFGAAICLGNTLVFMTDEEALESALAAARRLLLPGGRLLVQIVNYEGLEARGVRNLPVNVRPSEDGEIVFLRLLEQRPGGRVLFFPTTLRLRPDAEPPVELVRTRRVDLRGWRRHETSRALEKAGFEEVTLFGDMEGGSFDPVASNDLVIVARRAVAPTIPGETREPSRRSSKRVLHS